MEYKAGGQFFAEDFAHGGEILLRRGVQIEIRKRPPHQIQSLRRKIARRIARPPSHRAHGLRGFGNFDQSLNPARGGIGRQHLIDRAIEQFPGSQPRQAPQPCIDEIAFHDARDQFIAQLRPGLRRKQLQTCGGAPHFPQQAGVDAQAFCRRAEAAPAKGVGKRRSADSY